MAAPATLSKAGARLYEQLAPLAFEDEQRGFVLAHLCEAFIGGLQEVDDYARNEIIDQVLTKYLSVCRNKVTNPRAALATTGWTTAGTPTFSRVTSFPLDPPAALGITTGFKIVAAGNDDAVYSQALEVGKQYSVSAYGLTPSWSPLRIAGCELWLAADRITGKVDGDPVGTWSDSSGNGRDATQATGASQPLYKTGILNTKPVLRFDGSNDSLAIPGIVSNDATRTIIIVGKCTTPGAEQRFWSLSGNSSALSASAAGGNPWLYLQNAAAGQVSLGVAATAFGCAMIRFNSVSSAEGFVNGGVATAFDPDDAYQTGSTVFTLGATVGGAFLNLNGDIAEVIVYNSALSNTDRDKVRNYLGNKYNLGFGSVQNEERLIMQTLRGAGGTFAADKQLAAYGAWERLTATFTADDTTLNLRLGHGAVGESYFTAVMINEGSLIDYFDGDTPDTSTMRYSWVGTANASESTSEKIITTTSHKQKLGWSKLFDLNRIPDKAVPWLAQFVGVSEPHYAGEDAAAYATRLKPLILERVGWKRGTPASIRKAVEGTLTGTKTVFLTERQGSAYTMAVATWLSETPNATVTANAARSQKPGGILMNVSTLTGGDFVTLRDVHTDFLDVRTQFADFLAVRTNPSLT